MSKKKILFAGMSVLLASQIVAAPFISFAAEVTEIEKEKAHVDALIHRQDSPAMLSADTKTSVEAVKPKVGKVEVKNKPNRIVATFVDDTRTSMGFNWYTTDKFDSYVWVSESEDMSNAKAFKANFSEKDSHYLEKDEEGYIIYSVYDTEKKMVTRYFTDKDRAEGWNASDELSEKEEYDVKVQSVKEFSYKSTVKGLKPGTTYFYQVGSEKGGKSNVGTFKTSSVKQEGFEFIQYTDTQNAYWNENIIDEAAYAADTIDKALTKFPNTNFVIHTGDFVETSEVEDEWVDLMGQSEKSFLKTTIAGNSGNHDEYGLSYDERFVHKYTDHFNVPSDGKDDGGTYYSYDYNGVHFVVLNTNDYKNKENKSIGDEQQAWIKADIKAARANGAQWVVLQYHKPIFSKSYHSLQDADVQNVKDEFMKIIDEFDVDIALQGHDHVISRTKSLKYAPKSKSVFNAYVAEEAQKVDNVDYLKSPTGTTFVLPNTGGTKAYDAIYDKGLDHVKKVRKKLNWLTQETLDEYNNLFAYGGQPSQPKEFENSHSNNRDSKVQNFARYIVSEGKLTTELYQISGDLNEDRELKLVDSFVIEKEVDTNAKGFAPTSYYYGKDRYETALDVSRNHYDKAENVVIASGEVFADSLVAASISDLKDAPVLLTKASEISQEVLAELNRLGAKNIFILGGDSSVSKKAEEQLKGYSVNRLSGKTRFETAAEVAKYVLGETKSKNAVLVDGNGFADALSAGVASFKKDAPILYASTKGIDDLTEKTLKDAKIENIHIIGGKDSVTAETEKEAGKIAKVDRTSGKDRYETSLNVGKTFNSDSKNIILVSGEVYPDALVSAGMLQKEDANIILTNKNNSNDSVNTFVRGKDIENISVVGGNGSVSKLK